MKQLHSIQLAILQKLLFATVLPYSELKPSKKLENNQFSFHLDQLKKDGFVAKTDSGYTLTLQGKEYAGRLSTEETKIMVQSKIGARVACTRERGGKLEFLIYTRKKQPFFNCQGFLSGKVPFGESILESAKRELKEETNLEGEPQLVAVQHMLVYDEETGKLLEDKLFFFHRAHEPKGTLIPNNEGEHSWVPEDKIAEEVPNPFDTKEALLEEIELLKNFSGQVTFQEKRLVSKKF